MKQVSIVLLMFVFLITGVSVQAQSPVQVNQVQEQPHKLQPQLDKVNLKIEKLYNKNPEKIRKLNIKLIAILPKIKTNSDKYFLINGISSYIGKLETESLLVDFSENENLAYKIIVTGEKTLHTSFSSTKNYLEKNVYNNTSLSRETFYCGCDYSTDKVVDAGSCGFKNNGKYEKRSKKIEWEHVVPAHAFGQSFVEWREGHETCVTKSGKKYKGRKCAAKANETFKKMEADPMNLVPAIGSINAQRSNYSFSVIGGEKRQFGTCDFEISNRKAEPKEEIRGDIARIYKYMEAKYPGHGVISDKNEQLFEAWDKRDPIDNQECMRVKIIGTSSNVWGVCVK